MNQTEIILNSIFIGFASLAVYAVGWHKGRKEGREEGSLEKGAELDKRIAFLQNKWDRATIACSRFAKVHEPETDEDRQLVRTYNRQWQSATQYHIQHVNQLSPWERERTKKTIQDAYAIIGKSPRKTRR